MILSIGYKVMVFSLNLDVIHMGISCSNVMVSTFDYLSYLHAKSFYNHDSGRFIFSKYKTPALNVKHKRCPWHLKTSTKNNLK